jgi:hypothetical protein
MGRQEMAQEWNEEGIRSGLRGQPMLPVAGPSCSQHSASSGPPGVALVCIPSNWKSRPAIQYGSSTWARASSRPSSG